MDWGLGTPHEMFFFLRGEDCVLKTEKLCQPFGSMWWMSSKHPSLTMAYKYNIWFLIVICPRNMLAPACFVLLLCEYQIFVKKKKRSKALKQSIFLIASSFEQIELDIIITHSSPLNNVLFASYALLVVYTLLYFMVVTHHLSGKAKLPLCACYYLLTQVTLSSCRYIFFFTLHHLLTVTVPP